MKLLPILALFLLCCCARRVQVGQQYNRVGYSYRAEKGGITLWVWGPNGYDKAMDELCNVKKFYCLIEPTGETYRVEQTEKR